MLEHALRALALLALIWLTWGALTAPRRAASVSLHDVSRRALTDWTARPFADTLHAALRQWPAAPERDWLRALAGAGHTVTWSHDALPPTALELAPVPGPGADFVARVAAPRGRTVLLGDSLGTLDSVAVTGLGAAIRVASPVGAVSAGVDGHVATGARAVGTSRRVVVFGAAGWEAKFVVAALEESGWEVDARLVVAPDVAVTQGRPLPLDTARHTVVIALDSAASTAGRAIAEFVRDGGGAVLAADAVRDDRLRDLAPGRPGTPVRPSALTFAGADPRRALAFVPVTRLRGDAVSLEARDGHVIVTARRAGAGRVVMVGYAGTWRWRMAGGDAGPEEHRHWWSALVSAAAIRAAVPVDRSRADPAPFAALAAALGPPAAASPTSRRLPAPRYPLVFAAALTALFGEWLSRRLRGAS